MPAPRAPDESLGEWWVDNPWRITDGGHNLSSYERNRTYLNVPGEGFHDISGLTAADSKGDGHTEEDFRIAPDGKSVDLRAERQGMGSGRLYTINIQAIDSSGNAATESFQVVVPHDRRS